MELMFRFFSFFSSSPDPPPNTPTQTEYIFESMKAHLKRAPSLRGQALVRLSQLKIQSKQWPTLFNRTRISEMLDEVSKLQRLKWDSNDLFLPFFHHQNRLKSVRIIGLRTS